jgi:glutamate dehydrogenase (NADP+)
MSQNSMRLGWSREEVDEKLHNIMITFTGMPRKPPTSTAPRQLHQRREHRGFKKVANAMIDQG